MTEALVRREMQNNQIQQKNQAPLTRWEKTRAFCRGLIRGRPLVEVSCRALEKGGLNEEERTRHLNRILKSGTDERIRAVFRQAEAERIESSSVASYREAAALASTPSEAERQLAKTYVKAKDRKSSVKDVAVRIGHVTAALGVVAADIGWLLFGLEAFGADMPIWASILCWGGGVIVGVSVAGAYIDYLIGNENNVGLLPHPIDRDGKYELEGMLGKKRTKQMLESGAPKRRHFPAVDTPAPLNTLPEHATTK